MISRSFNNHQRLYVIGDWKSIDFGLIFDFSES